MSSIKQMLPSKLKYHLREMRLKFGWLINKDRVLPEMMIIGAQKSGTTSLFSYLSQHPDLIPSHPKELHFFSGGLDPAIDSYAKGLNWYKSKFPPVKGLAEGKKTFEATPIYLFNPLVAARIKSALPEVKMIVVLRNPTDRAISHYFHGKRKSLDPLPMMEALEAEESRLAPVLKSKDYKNEAFIQYSYKSRGLYAEQLNRYYELFSPEQLHVINSDDFFASPGSVLQQIFKFLSIDETFVPGNMRSRNVAKNKSDVDQQVYDYLNEFYAQPNKELYQLLGKDFGW